MQKVKPTEGSPENPWHIQAIEEYQRLHGGGGQQQEPTKEQIEAFKAAMREEIERERREAEAAAEAAAAAEKVRAEAVERARMLMVQETVADNDTSRVTVRNFGSVVVDVMELPPADGSDVKVSLKRKPVAGAVAPPPETGNLPAPGKDGLPPAFYAAAPEAVPGSGDPVAPLSPARKGAGAGGDLPPPEFAYAVPADAAQVPPGAPPAPAPAEGLRLVGPTRLTASESEALSLALDGSRSPSGPDTPASRPAAAEGAPVPEGEAPAAPILAVRAPGEPVPVAPAAETSAQPPLPEDAPPAFPGNLFVTSGDVPEAYVVDPGLPGLPETPAEPAAPEAPLSHFPALAALIRGESRPGPAPVVAFAFGETLPADGPEAPAFPPVVAAAPGESPAQGDTGLLLGGSPEPGFEAPFEPVVHAAVAPAPGPVPPAPEASGSGPALPALPGAVAAETPGETLTPFAGGSPPLPETVEAFVAAPSPGTDAAPDKPVSLPGSPESRAEAPAPGAEASVPRAEVHVAQNEIPVTPDEVPSLPEEDPRTFASRTPAETPETPESAETPEITEFPAAPNPEGRAPAPEAGGTEGPAQTGDGVEEAVDGESLRPDERETEAVAPREITEPREEDEETVPMVQSGSDAPAPGFGPAEVPSEDGGAPEVRAALVTEELPPRESEAPRGEGTPVFTAGAEAPSGHPAPDAPAPGFEPAVPGLPAEPAAREPADAFTPETDSPEGLVLAGPQEPGGEEGATDRWSRKDSEWDVDEPDAVQEIDENFLVRKSEEITTREADPVVAPGPVATDFWQAPGVAQLPPQLRDHLPGGSPLTREILGLMSRVLVTADPYSDTQEVRMTFHEDVLPGTEIRFRTEGGVLKVELHSATGETADLLRQEAPGLKAALESGTGSEVEVTVVAAADPEGDGGWA